MNAEALLERERMWGRLNRQDIAELTAENERLRELLAAARNSLLTAARALHSYLPATSDMALDAYRRSDPDGTEAEAADGDVR